MITIIHSFAYANLHFQEGISNFVQRFNTRTFLWFDVVLQAKLPQRASFNPCSSWPSPLALLLLLLPSSSSCPSHDCCSIVLSLNLSQSQQLLHSILHTRHILTRQNEQCSSSLWLTLHSHKKFAWLNNEYSYLLPEAHMWAVQILVLHGHIMDKMCHTHCW